MAASFLSLASDPVLWLPCVICQQAWTWWCLFGLSTFCLCPRREVQDTRKTTSLVLSDCRTNKTNTKQMICHGPVTERTHLKKIYLYRDWGVWLSSLTMWLDGHFASVSMCVYTFKKGEYDGTYRKKKTHSNVPAIILVQIANKSSFQWARRLSDWQSAGWACPGRQQSQATGPLFHMTSSSTKKDRLQSFQGFAPLPRTAIPSAKGKASFKMPLEIQWVHLHLGSLRVVSSV